jgi:KaiC/GvpD/RAD55 family RecA-like ATPase
MLRDGGGEQDPTDASGTPIAKTRIWLRRVDHEGQYYRGVRIVSMQTSDHAMDVREFCIEDGGIRVLDEDQQDDGFRAALNRSSAHHEDR